MDAWWFDVLSEGTLPGMPNAQGFIPCVQVYRSYFDSAKDSGLTHRGAANLVADYLKEKLPDFDPTTDKKKYPMHLLDGKVSNRWHYKFPPLSECRRFFAEKMRTGGQLWSDIDSDWESPVSAPDDWE